MRQIGKTLIIIIITAILVGGGVYYWQQKNNKAQTAVSQSSSQAKFPAVVYLGKGSLNSSASGIAEKKKIEEKLINPFADFFNEKNSALVTVIIEVPANVGEPYAVTGVFCGGGYACGAYQSFLFGKREQEFGYWHPDCGMSACHFSETFKNKYPQIKE